MWGCIKKYTVQEVSSLVPSLYVRVYRAGVVNVVHSGCSLTVCEGVSSGCIIAIRLDMFPHCMWGCIACRSIALKTCFVPSLYVRVYRSWLSPADYFVRSLTVCEGVSEQKGGGGCVILFPHCMWGCIGRTGQLIMTRIVPSLYVRVYRAAVVENYISPGSLTVCEGVSDVGEKSTVCIAFPHCMWGCIESPGGYRQWAQVPSLYVRVYRLPKMIYQDFAGSLTVCEGVSQRRQTRAFNLPFPHCMWGCIGIILAAGSFRQVPSLYVRVYRPLCLHIAMLFGSLIVCEAALC